MAVVLDPPRVAYVVSGDLVRYADLLPSNKGRSSHVHSLVHHLDLLDLSTLDDGSDEADVDTHKRCKSAGSSERERFLAAIGADVSTASPSKSDRRRAAVYRPHPATRQQLTTFHGESFVDHLTKGQHAQAGVSQPPRKRQRVVSDAGTSDSDSNTGSDSDVSRTSHGKRTAWVKNQFGLQDDCPTFDGLKKHVSLIAGASITAADLLATGQADIAIAWDGGRHHAKKHAASGFCYINDAVLAILALRKPRKVFVTTTVPRGSGDEATVRKTTIKRVQRVLYLDLDLHWGDGVEEAFHTSASVLTLSIHHYAPGFFPCYTASSDSRYGAPGSLGADPGAAGTTINIPLAMGTSDASLERVMEATVEPVVEAWQPEMVVVQCGVDGLAADPMAVWNLSAAAYVTAIQRVLGWKKPTLLLGGGGYDTANAARCWSLITAAALGRYEDTTKRRAAAPSFEPHTLVDRESVEAKPDDNVQTQSISLETGVPDHAFWPAYAPHYTLNVPAGEMIDHNPPAYFDEIHTCLSARIESFTKSS
jgi:acetoin utilization deacetylase AcuC-like enzyme